MKLSFNKYKFIEQKLNSLVAGLGSDRKDPFGELALLMKD